MIHRDLHPTASATAAFTSAAVVAARCIKLIADVLSDMILMTLLGEGLV